MRVESARHLLRVTAIATTLLAAASLPLAGLAQRLSTSRVVLVSVTDRNDAPVRDLSARDFVVREDGIAREVLDVSAAPPPTHIVLLVDDSTAAERVTAPLREGLGAFVQRVREASPPPAMSLVTFGDRPTTRVAFSEGAAAVERAVAGLFAQPSAGAVMLDAIVETARDLGVRAAERPVIVAFVVESGVEFSTLTHEQVTGALRGSGVSLWTIVIPARAPSLASEAVERARVISDGAEASGGLRRTVLTEQGLPSAFAQVAEALTSRYAVTYARPDTLIPPSSITVSARDGSLRVAASSWTGR